MNENNEILFRVKSLDAYISSLKGDYDGALARLAGKDDPFSIRRTLAIMIDKRDHARGVELIKNRPIHDEWCDKAIVVFVNSGELELAKGVIEWADRQADINIRNKCIYIYAESLFLYSFRDRAKGSPVYAETISEKEKSELIHILEVLKPIISVAKANNRVQNELESRSLGIALRIHSLLNQIPDITEATDLLKTRKPIPIVIAEAALEQRTIVFNELPQRLRNEHPNSFHAKKLAIIIESEYLNMWEDAFNYSLQLIDQAPTYEEKRDVFRILNFCASTLGENQKSGVEKLAKSSLNARDYKLYLIEKHLRKGEKEYAINILNDTKDENDYIWLQLSANCSLQFEKSEEAIDFLLKAGKLSSNPEILKNAAQLSIERGAKEKACEILEYILTLSPQDKSARQTLGGIYIELNNYSNALINYMVLHQQHSDDPNYAFNLANCLTLEGRLDEAYQYYEKVSQIDNSFVDAFLGMSQIRKSQNRIDESFTILHNIREKFWEIPSFVFNYMDIAYAAGKDKNAHQAFIKILEFQKQNKIEDEVIKNISLENIKKEIEKSKEADSELAQHLLSGKIAWIAIEEYRNTIPYLGWANRTQQISWLIENPNVIAHFSIYSTNSFGVLERNAVKRLERIKAPKRGQKIVADMSALITLHRLGLITDSASYFEEILVPNSYYSKIIKDSSRLIPHQLSQKNSIEMLKDAIDNNLVKISAETEKDNNSEIVHIKYDLQSGETIENSNTIFELINVLNENGLMTYDKYNGICNIYSDRMNISSNRRKIKLSQSIILDIVSLNILSSYEIIASVFNAFNVIITPDTRDDINQKFRLFKYQETVNKWYSDFWNCLNRENRFRKSSYFKMYDPDLRGKYYNNYIAFDSIQLAQKCGLPLLVDDRMCQSIIININKKNQDCAFGTDCLLNSFWEGNIVSKDRLIDAYMNLIEWRYKFIIISPEILKYMVDQFIENPPGIKLIKVAQYIHDSMNDPGLFAGLEPTEPKTTIASKLYQAWVFIVSDLIIEIWADEKYDDEKAGKISDWALEELLPSPPLNINIPGQDLLSSSAYRIVLGNAFLHSVEIKSQSRANCALTLIADKLKLSDNEYEDILFGVTDAKKYQ